jgi:hypothetical protein
MNTVVQAETLTLGVVITIGNVTVSTSILYNVVANVETICLHTFNTISINGHSISAINPEFLKVGELTTSFVA